MIRLTVPAIDDDDVGAIAEVLRSGFLVQGRRVAAFETAVSDYTGAAHAVALNSATSALHLSLLALGIGPGSRVVVPSYSWPATINVVALTGAEPVIVDVESETFNIDTRKLEETLAQTRIDAIIPVHAFGGMADVETIGSLAGAHGALVLEDAACALGAGLNGTAAGRYGIAGCFSFHPRKAVTTGEGGVVVTDDAELADRIRALRNHGIDPSASSPDFVLPGFNARMTDLQGALGLEQMRKLPYILFARRTRAARYDELLRDTPIVTPQALHGCDHAYQSYVVTLPEGVESRDVINVLREHRIESTIGTYALPFIRWVRERYLYEEDDFPVAASLMRSAVSLPLHDRLSAADQERVVEVISNLVAACSVIS